MRPPIIGRAEIRRLGLQLQTDTLANTIAAERVIPFGIGVAVERSTAGRGVADDERRLAVQHVVDAKAKLEPLSNPEDGCNVEIVSAPAASCSPG